MARLTLDDARIIAAAIANARGNRRGMPTITNVLDVLPQKLRDEVMDDAMAVLRAVNAADVSMVEQAGEPPLHRSGFR